VAILKSGLSGEPVRLSQKKLGVEADGVFGPNTESTLKAYQLEHGFSVDGVAGPDTFAQMGLCELILLRRGSKGDQVKIAAGSWHRSKRYIRRRDGKGA